MSNPARDRTWGDIVMALGRKGEFPEIPEGLSPSATEIIRDLIHLRSQPDGTADEFIKGIMQRASEGILEAPRIIPSGARPVREPKSGLIAGILRHI